MNINSNKIYSSNEQHKDINIFYLFIILLNPIKIYFTEYYIALCPFVRSVRSFVQTKHEQFPSIKTFNNNAFVFIEDYLKIICNFMHNLQFPRSCHITFKYLRQSSFVTVYINKLI